MPFIRAAIAASMPFKTMTFASALRVPWGLQLGRCCPNVRRFAVVPGVEAPVTSHLSLVPQLLSQTLKQGDIAVDATAGNGYDTTILARLVLSDDGSAGQVVSFDVQDAALEKTRARLLTEFREADIESRVTLLRANHKELDKLDAVLPPSSTVKAFTFNLGYLPGGDKSIITQFEDTLVSLRGAAERTAPGGLICVTCYTGHDGGAKETELVRLEISKWEQSVWRVCEHKPLNWPASPVLFTAHRFQVC